VENDIYSVVIVFRRQKKEENFSATFKIRRSKKDSQINIRLEGVNTKIRNDDLSWSTRYKNSYVTVLERIEKNLYVDRHTREEVPVAMGINLEDIVNNYKT
jgi:hypothetical protein